MRRQDIIPGMTIWTAGVYKYKWQIVGCRVLAIYKEHVSAVRFHPLTTKGGLMTETSTVKQIPFNECFESLDALIEYLKLTAKDLSRPKEELI